VKKSSGFTVEAQPDPALAGVGTVTMGAFRRPFETEASTPEEWRALFGAKIKAIEDHFLRHNPVELIAKTSAQLLANAAARQRKVESGDLIAVNATLTELADVEIVQALALRTAPPHTAIPASPSHMARFYPLAEHSILAFSRMQPSVRPGMTGRDALIHKLRLQTIYMRNSFSAADCEVVVLDILGRMDRIAGPIAGRPSFTDFFSSLFAINRMVRDRVDQFLDRCRDGFEAKSREEILVQIQFFCDLSPAARRAWSLCKKRCQSLDDYRWVAFQLSELCNSWMFTLEKATLSEKFGEPVLVLLDRMSLRFGDLADANPEHFYLNNPIWRRPFIALADDRLFLPLPGLIYSFPFYIIEHLIASDMHLKKAYTKARSDFLEDSVERLVKSALPSANVYRGVAWAPTGSTDEFENDVVALLGNTIFLFEAKSGRLDQAARRGGELKLIRNFEDLFIEPAKQAARLETYLNETGAGAKLWIKKTGERVDLDLTTPKVVHKFSICLESLAALSSARNMLEMLGVANKETPWAPVLSLGDLMLVWRQLDTEISFFHYLTRRATLESVVDFEGDEQDLLSLYLINGLRIDPKKMDGRQLRFLEVDNIVRVERTPNENRKRFEIRGLPLSGYWKGALREIYQNVGQRHRFDILQTIMNQSAEALAAMEDIGRRWKRGTSGRKDGDIMFANTEMGGRVFVLAYYLSKRPFTSESWRDRSREVAREGAAGLFSGSDCVTLLRDKKSKALTFDGVSFHRMIAVKQSEEKADLSRL
jgi:hypothetical protein